MEELIFENFKNSENNIISVELAKVLGYTRTNGFFLKFFFQIFGDKWTLDHPQEDLPKVGYRWSQTKVEGFWNLTTLVTC